MEPFKNLLNVALVQQAAALLQPHAADFDGARFAALATQGLDGLEMKARALHICSALEATLPTDFHRAMQLMEDALAPPDGDSAPGLRGWILWPFGEYIARHGQAHPERALAALHELTQRFTAEFAIRPFLLQQPALTLATLQAWCADPSEHVRRLASEGSRPRLPWGLQLKPFIEDPSPTLPLLLALQDDDSEYVRRSVANHLNDIAKDHPALVAEWLETHLPGASTARRRLLRHASRTLIKRGDLRVLQAWGLGGALRGQATLELSPAQAVVGGELQLTVQLRSSAARAQHLAVDYVVHHTKADGSTSPKVFKGWTLELPPRGEVLLHKRHSLRVITTRRYHAGQHTVVLQVNGRAVAEVAFSLALA